VQALNGDLLAGPARIGVVEDFADTLLSGVLTEFSEKNPEANVQVRVAGSADLLELMQAGQLDVLLCLSGGDDPAAIRSMPMQWLGNADLGRQEVLPLAVLERRCRFRDAALAALDRAGRPYRIVLETPSLAALRAAVESGLGITCRTRHFLQDVIGAEGALPSLPHVAYVRHICGNPHPIISRLADVIHAAALEL
jgi:DNA-binding transcriptional LysR family regulator